MFDTFAVTGAYPKASSTGKVRSVPLPTTVLIVPAPKPAAPIAIASQALKLDPTSSSWILFSC